MTGQMMSPEGVTVLDFADVMTPEMVSDLLPACELGTAPCDQPSNCDRPAAWVMHRVICCSAGGGCSLACTKCKEDRLMDAFGLECEHCGAVFFHAPQAYRYIEPLSG